MDREPQPLFLERRLYRRRRFGDAAKLLPIVGLVLFLMPILWSDAARTAPGMVYLFSVWILLILVVAFLSRMLARDEDASRPSEDRPGGEG
jgi:hypothetical protein